MSITTKTTLSILALVLPVAVIAQSTPEPGASSATGNFACVDAFVPGAVDIALAPSQPSVKSGEAVAFSGTVKNNLNFPITNSTLHVKIFRKDQNSVAAQDGDALVDQLVVTDAFGIAADSEKNIAFFWGAPSTATPGEYYAVASLTVAGSFPLSGSSVSDQSKGSEAKFSLTNASPVVPAVLDKQSVTLNGQDVSLAGEARRFGATDSIAVKVNIKNDSPDTKRVLLVWEEHADNALLPQNERSQKTENLTLDPQSTKEVAYTISHPESTYLAVTLTDKDSKSLLNIPFTREGGAPQLRLAGLSGFPLAAGVEAESFGCAETLTDTPAPGAILTLTMRDADNKVIHTARMAADVPPAIAGWKDVFTPKNSYTDLTLTATLEYNGLVVKEVTLRYDCGMVGGCTDKAGEESSFPKLYVVMGAVLLGLIIALVVGFLIYRKRRAARVLEWEKEV